MKALIPIVSPTTGSKTDIDYQITRESAEWYHVCARNVIKMNIKMKNNTIRLINCTRFQRTDWYNKTQRTQTKPKFKTTDFSCKNRYHESNKGSDTNC